VVYSTLGAASRSSLSIARKSARQNCRYAPAEMTPDRALCVRAGYALKRRLSWLSAVLVALTSATGLTSCRSATCTSVGVNALGITVLDAAGTRICNATVVVTDGSFSATLPGLGRDPRTCTYYGPLERAGTYSIDVRSGAKESRVNDVKVTGGACHVHPQAVTVTLK